MKTRLLVAASNIGLVLLLVMGTATQAAEIKVLSSTGVQTIMEGIAPMFERATGHKLAISFANTEEIMKRVAGGEAADVIIAFPLRLEGLERDGKVVAGSVTAMARSGIGLAVRKGAPKPDISSPEALKRTLLAAKSIACANPARGSPSGTHFVMVLDRLGISSEIKPRLLFPKRGLAGELVASGEAEVAVQQIPELVQVDGIDLVAPFPGDLQVTFVYATAITSNAAAAAEAKVLTEFLRTPDVTAVIRAKGFDPATP